MQKTGFFLLLIVLVLLIPLQDALQAGITGKIRGTVKDASTGEPLPGANVFISAVWRDGSEISTSTQLGAASDVNGKFIILKIPPGTYSLSASMMGYTTNIRQRVRVNIDRTTVIDFQLKEEVLDLGAEVVVEARRDVVQLDVASTENYISEEQYQDTPFANRIEDMVGLQSGVTGNIIEGEISIREGDANEIGVMLDGMLMVDKKFNRPMLSVNPGIVQEIKVMRNGFNAEYGQSRSGMINVVTKNPESKFHLTVDYQFDPAHRRHYGRSVFDTSHRWDWRLIAGPNAMEGDSLFLNEGRLGRWKYWRGWNQVSEELLNDTNPDNDLTPEEALELWKWRHRPMEYGNEHGHNLDIALSGGVPYLPLKTTFLAGFKYERRPFTYPQSRPYFGEKISSLKLVTRVTDDIKLTLTSLYSEINTVTTGKSTSEWSEEDRISYSGGDWQIYYPYRKPTADRYTTLIGAKWLHTVKPTLFYEINLNFWNSSNTVGRADTAKAADGRYFGGRLYYDPQSGWIPTEWGAEDLATDMTLSGGAYTWEDSYNRRVVVNAMVTNQFHPSHEFKAGLEFAYDELHQNRVFWDHEDPDQEFIRQNDATPYEVSAFAQDKIEFKGMIANIGVRFDAFNTNTNLWDIHQCLDYTNGEIYQAVKDGTYPKTREEAKFYVSPRIGISHPLTEKSKIYFNYGHFVQTPPTQALYQTTLDGRMPRVQWMGNPVMNFEKTIAYELGYDHNLNDLFQLHVGAYYKDYHDAASGMVYAHSDQSLVLEWASQRENREIRGIEIELRKSYGRWITGWLNYNISKKSVSDLEIPDLSDIPIITDDPNIGINGELKGVPRQDVKDVVPYGRGVITFSVPSGWGPELSGFKLLERTSLSLQLYYQGGRFREHPDKEWRRRHPDVKFRELDRYRANMRLSRVLTYGSLNLEFYMDVSNIFHTEYRNPPGGRNGEDYYTDLYNSGRLDQVGTDELTNPEILNTESDNVYWAKLKQYIFGLRINL